MAKTEPNIIYLKRVMQPKEATELVGDFVPDMEPTIKGPTIVYDEDTGGLVAAYLPLGNVARIRRMVRSIKYPQLARTSHYQSRSKTFGYAPRRVVLGREGCVPSDLAAKHPDIEAELGRLADECAEAFTNLAPELAEQDRATTSAVLPDWRIGESKLWTSGVINDTAQLPYHRDGFNFPSWSAMPSLRRGARGGYLHIPEYGLVLPCADGYASYFKGQELVHGVTPIHKKTADGYRFTIVFYALRGMKDCFTYAEEAAYARRRRSERERDMARRMAEGDMSIPGYSQATNDAEAKGTPESCAEAADMNTDDK